MPGKPCDPGLYSAWKAAANIAFVLGITAGGLITYGIYLLVLSNLFDT